MAGSDSRRPRRPRRGTFRNPPNRFERLCYEPTPDAELEGSDAATQADAAGAEQTWPGEPAPDPRTRLLADPSRSIVATNRSPDVGFDASVNPYRGCEHGCVYCYARPGHEYLGLSAGLDFETQILVKHDAAALLRRKLAAPAWRPQVVALSGVTDPYQPAERRLRITRACLDVLAEFRNPVGIVTKSWLVTRDADRLAELAALRAACVCLSITTLDPELARRMEPRASSPSRRLGAIERLAEAGVPVGVLVAPVVPGLTDHEMPRILEAAARAGAGFAGRVLLRLPHGVKELFDTWLEREFPERRHRVLARIREVRGGRLSDPRFGSRQRGEGLYARQLERWFELARRRAGLAARAPRLSIAAFRRPAGKAGAGAARPTRPRKAPGSSSGAAQLGLFDPPPDARKRAARWTGAHFPAGPCCGHTSGRADRRCLPAGARRSFRYACASLGRDHLPLHPSVHPRPRGLVRKAV